MREETLGGLRVRIVGGNDGEGGGNGPAVVLLHGFGAPGEDLIPIWRVLRVPSGTRFVFPEAPLSLGPGFGGGRAWWMIDIARMERAIRQGDLRDMSNEIPAGLSAARQSVIAMLAELEQAIQPSTLVLGGFSQGAMLACDVTLRTDLRLAGLALLSGTLIAAGEWTPLMPKRSGMKVFQSHGREDPILPFSIAERLRDELRAAELDVQWIPFTGGHGLPPNVLQGLGEFLDGSLQ